MRPMTSAGQGSMVVDLAPWRRSSRWERVALATGIGWVVLEVVLWAGWIALIVPRLPPLDGPPELQAKFYGQADAIQTAFDYLYVLVNPFLLMFLGGLYSVMRRAEGAGGTLSIIALVAGTLMIAIPIVMWLVEVPVATSLAQAGGDPKIAAALSGLGPLSWAMSGFPRAILLGAVSILILDAGLARRWTAWFGFGLALLSLLSTGTLVLQPLFPSTVLANMLLIAWVLSIALALLNRVRIVGPVPQPDR